MDRRGRGQTVVCGPSLGLDGFRLKGHNHRMMKASARDAVVTSDALHARFRTHLRLARADSQDAVYIVRLRTDPDLGRYLNFTSDSVDQQLSWLRSYKARELAGKEYYFIVVSDGLDAGVIRLYDFRDVDGAKTFTWGSWIIPVPRAPGLVTVSLLLAYEIAFETLGFDRAQFDARNGNAVAIALYLRSGAKIAAADDQDTYFTFDRADFVRFREANSSRYALHRQAG